MNEACDANFYLHTPPIIILSSWPFLRSRLSSAIACQHSNVAQQLATNAKLFSQFTILYSLSHLKMHMDGFVGVDMDEKLADELSMVAIPKASIYVVHKYMYILYPPIFYPYPSPYESF